MNTKPLPAIVRIKPKEFKYFLAKQTIYLSLLMISKELLSQLNSRENNTTRHAVKILYTTILFVITACHDGQKHTVTTPTNQYEFKLIDSLGSVSIAFPERMDTFFSWIQQSDCGKPCEHGDYRFQSKRNPLFKESGFFWIGEPEDSVDQLSIYHLRPDTLLKHKDSLIIQMRNPLLDNMLSKVETRNVLSDTLVKIGDRYFYVFQVADFNRMTGVRDRRLIAYTTISGTVIEFHYKLLTTRYDKVLTGFFEKSMNNLRTVRLKDGS